jgi:hypothetical protein
MKLCLINEVIELIFYILCSRLLLIFAGSRRFAVGPLWKVGEMRGCDTPGPDGKPGGLPLDGKKICGQRGQKGD